jgi:predicted methyltransferase
MANIKKIKINEEWYCKISDVLEALKESKDVDNAIASVEALIKPKEKTEELSDFNKKLKQGLNWSPKED